jgi:hypothetical protein
MRQETSVPSLMRKVSRKKDRTLSRSSVLNYLSHHTGSGVACGMISSSLVGGDGNHKGG